MCSNRIEMLLFSENWTTRVAFVGELVGKDSHQVE